MKEDKLTVDDYLIAFSDGIKEKLMTIRKIIKENAPEAIEEISYGMPAYKTHKKPLVYFAGYNKHIGFYATPTGHKEFDNELKNYKQGKGSVQFELDKPIPYELIAQIVKFRVQENNLKYKSQIK